jgi:formylglycine-generating enzyme required for sulfatase activity
VSPEVTGGTYDRTFSYGGPGNGPADAGDPASVSAFRLDKYLVTVGRFRQFVHAAQTTDAGVGWRPAPGSGKHTHLNGGLGLVAVGGSSSTGYESGWNAADDAYVAPTSANLACDPLYATWTPSAGGNEKRPINCVTWQESYAFCIWDGGFLPSESEWEYAAAGGASEHDFPWGNAAPGTDNTEAIYGCNYPSGGGACTGVTNIAPVGSAPAGAGPFGQLDLAGDAWEWTLDWYGVAYVSPCADCAALTPTFGRSLRGGNFELSATYLPTAYRLGAMATVRQAYTGFRCARSP